MTFAKLLGAGLLACLVLSGCSAIEPGTPSPHSTAHPGLSLPGPATLSCSSKAGGGAALSIRSVSVTPIADSVRVQFKVNSIPKSFSQNIEFTVIFSDADGSHGGIFLTGLTQGRSTPDVTEFSDDTTSNRVLKIRPSFRSAGTVVTDYPSDLVKKLHKGWIWRAVTNLDGVDIDHCGVND